MKPRSVSSRAERLTAISNSASLPVDRDRRGDRLLEHEVGQLADAVVLLGSGNELGRGDRTLFGVRPARERFGADDPAGRKVELGLIRNPHFAAVDRIVELAEHRQLPRGILEAVGIVELPLEPVVRGLFGGDQGARQPIGQRAAASDLDAEGDGQVDLPAGDAGRVAEQRIKGVEVIAERRARLLEPGENPAIALEQGPVGRPDRQARDDLLDQLALGIGGKSLRDFFIIEHPCRDQRILAPVAVGAKRVEVGQVRHRVDQAAHAEPAPPKRDRHRQQHEQSRRNVDKDEVRFEGVGQDEQ